MGTEKILCTDEKYKECDSYKKLDRGKLCKVDGCRRKKTNAVNDSNNTTDILSTIRPGKTGGPIRLSLVEQDATTTDILPKLVANEL